MNYITSNGIQLELGRVDRRIIDRAIIGKEPPQPPTRKVIAWGDIEEEIPIYDDPIYQAELLRYNLWLAKEQAAILAPAITVNSIVDWSELTDLSSLGLMSQSTNAGLLLYILSDDDTNNVIDEIMYHSTVTPRGIREAEYAFNATWLDKPVIAWRVPGTPALFSVEFEARRAAQVYSYTWCEFCEMTGQEQSAIVAHYRITSRLAWLQGEYDRAKNTKA